MPLAISVIGCSPAVPGRRRKQLDTTSHNGRYLEHWTGGRLPDRLRDHPVTFVTWQAAVAFCKWRGKRLPTEIEYEWAAQDGELMLADTSTVQEPAADPGVRRVVRGGSWGANAANLRVRYRDSHRPYDAREMVGFRCAKSSP